MAHLCVRLLAPRGSCWLMEAPLISKVPESALRPDRVLLSDVTSVAMRARIGGGMEGHAPAIQFRSCCCHTKRVGPEVHDRHLIRSTVHISSQVFLPAAWTRGHRNQETFRSREVATSR